MSALQDIAHFNAEIKDAYAKIRALEKRRKIAIGEYLISMGWRKTNSGWVEPGELPTYNSVVYGTYAAFKIQHKTNAEWI